MKKVISIFLLLIFTFNLGGYYLFFWLLKKQSDLDIIRNLDQGNYESYDLMEIKIPLALPYPIQPSEFERKDGEFDHQGRFYKMVKQKFENDTITIVCIKDDKAKNIADARDQFHFRFSGGSNPNTETALNYFWNLQKILFSNTLQVKLSAIGWSREITRHDSQHYLSTFFLFLLTPPPECIG